MDQKHIHILIRFTQLVTQKFNNYNRTIGFITQIERIYNKLYNPKAVEYFTFIFGNLRRYIVQTIATRHAYGSRKMLVNLAVIP